MASYFEDIINQPNDIRNALDKYFSEEYLSCIKNIPVGKFTKVIFTGMGSSNFGSIGASLILNENHITSCVFSTGQLLHYGLNIVDKDTLLVVVSQSGESGEVVSLLDILKGEGNILGITNDNESTLAKKSKWVLNLFVDEEESVTTRTYLATIAVNYILASYLAEKDLSIVKKELYSSMDVLGNFIEDYKEKSEEYYNFIKDVNFVSTIGKGYSLSSALASGLFFKEVSKFPSEGMDLSEFRHGPVEIVDEKFGCIVFAPEGDAAKIVINTAIQIAKRGGKVVLVTNNSDVAASENMILMRYEKINEELSPIIDIAGAQFICNILAEKRNFIPGKFRWSSKITKGE